MKWPNVWRTYAVAFISLRRALYVPYIGILYIILQSWWKKCVGELIIRPIPPRSERRKVDRLKHQKINSLESSAEKWHKRDITLEFHMCAEPYRHINGCSHMSLKHVITFDAICFSASYLKKSFQRSRNVLDFTWRNCSNVSITSWKLLEEEFTTYQEHAGTFGTLLEADVAI